MNEQNIEPGDLVKLRSAHPGLSISCITYDGRREQFKENHPAIYLGKVQRTSVSHRVDIFIDGKICWVWRAEIAMLE